MRIFDVYFVLSLNRLFEQTVELLVIWDAMAPMWRQCNICCSIYISWNCLGSQFKNPKKNLHIIGSSFSTQEVNDAEMALMRFHRHTATQTNDLL